ncbi:MAG: hypothetical protein K2L74_04275, partial [Muribaculaceae bacterium]|nr:hypothetical protein [Muribaculaceae bacterium]
VKPVASVHPEPGSNSSLLFILFFFFSAEKAKIVVVNLLPSQCLSKMSNRASRPLIESPGRIDKETSVSFSCTTSS